MNRGLGPQQTSGGDIEHNVYLHYYDSGGIACHFDMICMEINSDC